MTRRVPEIPAPPLSLAETQRLVRTLVAAPEGVRPALAERDDAEGEALSRLIVSDAKLAAADRLDVYANAYFYRILDVLRGDFPGLTRALGDAAMNDLVTSYLLVAPPAHYSLRHAGDRLPGFLATHEAAEGMRARFPFAADLARFERALTDAFDAPDAHAAQRADLAGVAPEAFEALPLRLATGAQLVPLRAAVHTLDRDAVPPREDGALESAGVVPETTDAVLLVWRRDLTVRRRELAEPEAGALASVASGTTFGELCEALGEQMPAETAAQQAAMWLAEWLDAGLLARFDANSPDDASADEASATEGAPSA